MLAARQFHCVPEQFRILMQFIVALANSATDAETDDMNVKLHHMHWFLRFKNATTRLNHAVAYQWSKF